MATFMSSAAATPVTLKGAALERMLSNSELQARVEELRQLVAETTARNRERSRNTAKSGKLARFME